MNLIRRSLVVVSMAALSVVSVPALHASIFHPVHAMFTKSQTVHFNLRNDSKADIQLRVGEDSMTVVAGKTLEVKLAAGTRILTGSDTATHKAGELLVEVSPSLSGATISIH